MIVYIVMMDTKSTNKESKEIVLSADAGWASAELNRVVFGDARLERRIVRVAEELSGQPQEPINMASSDAAATKGAYRLFNNNRVKADRIIDGHREKTISRMKEEPIVIAIQDTSFFNFSSHKKTIGLGPISERVSNSQGLIVHTTLAVTPTGLPLGILNHRCWARAGYKTPEERKQQERESIEHKESYRWVEALRDVTKMAVHSFSGKIITVADRECDIYEFLQEAEKLNANYVIRSSHNRYLQSESVKYLNDFKKNLAIHGRLEIEAPSSKRKAVLNLRFSEISIRTPGRITRAKNAKGVNCWVVYLDEPLPPPGQEPISWTLLTNIPVESVDDACQRIQWYRRRWSIEDFHKVIKAGCQVEDCRLQTADKLKRYLALFSVIAWRIFWMVHIRRADPTASANLVLTTCEINTICCLKRFKEKKLEPHKLNVRQAVTAIACLGGYLNRKNDPFPGYVVIWRGWQRLSSMTELYESFDSGCG